MRSCLHTHGQLLRTRCAAFHPRDFRWNHQVPSLIRHHSSTLLAAHDEQQQQHIAVLGGGITGLVSTFYLAKNLPSTKVTLFDRTDKLGGWLRSEYVDVGTGNVLFEQGPRTLRPAAISGWVTLQLIKDLGLEDQIISTSKNAVAAQNRYVYYPDHLVRMPGPGVSLLENVSNFFTEPIFRGVLRGIIRDLVTKPRAEELRDESVASFISRRFDSRMANNILSAVIHGIYAGDIYQLSMKTLFPRLWDYERIATGRGPIGRLTEGSVFPRLFGKYAGTTQIDQGDLPLLNNLAALIKDSEILQTTANSSVYTFKNGIGTLATALETRIRQMPNAEIRLQTHAELQQKSDTSPGSSSDMLQVECKSTKDPHGDSETLPITHCIYACRHPLLSSGFSPPSSTSTTAGQQRSGYTSTVQVINLYYPDPTLLPRHGFGYLIPRSVPVTHNPERALGVVFDSDATPTGQDDLPPGNPTGTKLTVMLGGHYWNSPSPTALPADEASGATMARSLLARHLGITAEPRAIRVALQKDCIPQYLVGHDDVMAEGDRYLRETYAGRVRVGGSPYTGVGLNDCVKAGRDLAVGFLENRDERGNERGDRRRGGTEEEETAVKTGLEMFRGGRKWNYVKFDGKEGRWRDVDLKD